MVSWLEWERLWNGRTELRVCAKIKGLKEPRLLVEIDEDSMPTP
jgi:hypothetical protein